MAKKRVYNSILNVVDGKPGSADLEVGGVNLIQNGNFFNGLSNWNINSPIETLPETLTIYSGTDLPDGVLSCLKVTATAYGQGVWQNLMNKLELNRTYTLSFLLKKSGSEEFNLYFGHEENIQIREITKTDTWERHIYRFTPTTHQNIVFYANNAATFFITNIQLEKGTVASDFKSGYLEDALKQTAEINGGLILGSIIGARDEQNIVRSYISGLKNNQTAIATGVEGFGTESEKKSIDLRHDGSGHLAGGNISWDDNGNVYTKGEIDAQSGKIGNFEIIDGKLVGNNQIGDRIEIYPKENEIKIYNRLGSEVLAIYTERETLEEGGTPTFLTKSFIRFTRYLNRRKIGTITIGDGNIEFKRYNGYLETVGLYLWEGGISVGMGNDNRFNIRRGFTADGIEFPDVRWDGYIPTYSDVAAGSFFMDSNGFLKVKK